jgi:BirA family biotin operon repressor/biotin-[acetyl-CoA-carboxylase] ligase
MHTILTQLADAHQHSITALCQHLSCSTAQLEHDIHQLQSYGVDIQQTQAGWQWLKPIELLDSMAIFSALTPQAQQHIKAIQVESVLESTNQTLLEHPSQTPRACLSEYQTAGRGQQGKHWVSPYASGLCLSVQWASPHRPTPALSLVMGVALAELLQSQGIKNIRLKWPNDICVNGKKLAGLLLETRYQAGMYKCVLGLGLNIAVPTQHAAIDQAWIDCQQLGLNLSRNIFAAACISAILNAKGIFAAQGFAAFSEAWHDFDMLRGQQLTLPQHNGETSGTVLGVNAEGALLLETATGLVAYAK